MKTRGVSVLARFDGKVFVPVEPVNLPKGKAVQLSISAPRKRAVAKGKRRLNYELGSRPVSGGARDGSTNLDRYVYRGGK